MIFLRYLHFRIQLTSNRSIVNFPRRFVANIITVVFLFLFLSFLFLLFWQFYPIRLAAVRLCCAFSKETIKFAMQFSVHLHLWTSTNSWNRLIVKKNNGYCIEIGQWCVTFGLLVALVVPTTPKMWLWEDLFKSLQIGNYSCASYSLPTLFSTSFFLLAFHRRKN